MTRDRLVNMPTIARAPARGSYRADDHERLHPQIVLRLDRDTFSEVRLFAAKHALSFNAAVRQLIETGLAEHTAESYCAASNRGTGHD